MYYCAEDTKTQLNLWLMNKHYSCVLQTSVNCKCFGPEGVSWAIKNLKWPVTIWRGSEGVASGSNVHDHLLQQSSKATFGQLHKISCPIYRHPH